MRMNYYILSFLANEGKCYSITTTKPPLGRQSILIDVRPFDNRERFISNCLSSLPSLNMTIFFPKPGKAFKVKVNVCLSSVPLMPQYTRRCLYDGPKPPILRDIHSKALYHPRLPVIGKVTFRLPSAMLRKRKAGPAYVAILTRR